MYVVRDKKTKKIIHINPAPLSQKLGKMDIYYKFDNQTMEIGKTDLPELPKNFKIDSKGIIIAMSLKEQVKAGIIQLNENQELLGDKIVEKSISQKVKDGIIELLPSQKIVGKGSEEKIVEKTPSEMISEKIIELAPNQTIKGTKENEVIAQKSLHEQLKEGLIKLGPNQRIVDDQIVTYSIKKMVDQGLIDFNEYKKRKIEEFSELSFEIRETLIPEYKLVNVGLNIYDENETDSIKATIQAFRKEFYRLKVAIEKAKTVKEVEAVKEKFPRKLIITNVKK